MAREEQETSATTKAMMKAGKEAALDRLCDEVEKGRRSVKEKCEGESAGGGVVRHPLVRWCLQLVLRCGTSTEKRKRKGGLFWEGSRCRSWRQSRLPHALAQKRTVEAFVDVPVTLVRDLLVEVVHVIFLGRISVRFFQLFIDVLVFLIVEQIVVFVWCFSHEQLASSPCGRSFERISATLWSRSSLVLFHNSWKSSWHVSGTPCTTHRGACLCRRFGNSLLRCCCSRSKYAVGRLMGNVMESGDVVSRTVLTVDGYAFPHSFVRIWLVATLLSIWW